MVRAAQLCSKHLAAGMIDFSAILEHPVHLLTDDQFEAFLTDGFVILTPEVPEATHDHYYASAQQLYAKAALLGPERMPGTNHLQLLGDNLPGLVPRLTELFEDPVLMGALTSILGEDDVLLPHCFCHRS